MPLELHHDNKLLSYCLGTNHGRIHVEALSSRETRVKYVNKRSNLNLLIISYINQKLGN